MINQSKLNCIEDMLEVLEELGFLPLFHGTLPGLSIEEMTSPGAWWTGDPDTDPWQWRQRIASIGQSAYGKFFEKKAAFVSREWFPILACYRREGYDFDTRYELGMASAKAQRIMEEINQAEQIPSHVLKKRAGFGKEGFHGFDAAVTDLQMQCYITIRDFTRKVSSRGEEYGWPGAIYSTAENFFGEEYIRSAYDLEPGEALERLSRHAGKLCPDANTKQILKWLG